MIRLLNKEYALEMFREWYLELIQSDDRNKRIVRWIAILVMVVSASVSMFVFFKIYRIDVFQPIGAMPLPSISEERSKVEASIELYQAMIATRKDSQRIANDIVRLGRNPFDKMESPEEVPLISPEPSVEDLVDLPPIVIVRAVMVMGKDSAAVVDIDGVGYGIVVKRGMSFLNGKGRFVSIKAKELVFRWNGKNVPVPVDL